MAAPAERKLVATVRARCEAQYAVEASIRQHRVTSDEPAARGGADSGPNPLELVATALASCTAITLRMYAERKGWDLGTVIVECRVFAEGKEHRLERSIDLGAPIPEEQRSRLAEIAEKTPVTRLVKAGAPVATELR
jgi:putative redox protein